MANSLKFYRSIKHDVRQVVRAVWERFDAHYDTTGLRVEVVPAPVVASGDDVEQVGFGAFDYKRDVIYLGGDIDPFVQSGQDRHRGESRRALAATFLHELQHWRQKQKAKGRPVYSESGATRFANWFLKKHSRALNGLWKASL